MCSYIRFTGQFLQIERATIETKPQAADGNMMELHMLVAAAFISDPKVLIYYSDVPRHSGHHCLEGTLSLHYEGP